ncbi:MAG: Tim44/TimA family putative adaptor protein [Acetobacteraceae bacterium]|jgi:predicted lipid-binding transport protein (Tim44 family)
MGASSFPIDLILFGMIAAFLVLRLRSILGRRTGFERPGPPPQPLAGQAAGPVIEGQAEPATATSPRALPEPTSAIGQALGRMQSVDHSFEPAAFLDGAEKAFRIIVTAFAAGDRTTLQGLLSADTWRAFEQAITLREAGGQTQVSTIHAVHSATIENAELRGQVASITVRFVSDQTSITRDKDGNPVTGTDAVTEITDLWTFERNLSTRDPVWRLVSAASA